MAEIQKHPDFGTLPQRTLPEADPRGSIWRRWDPHVHLPGTLAADAFGTMSVTEALDLLATRSPNIEVVGVTDYFTTRSYRRAVEAWQAGAGSSDWLLFPNVELRLDIVTARSHALNLHLLCAPDQIDELEKFLSSLEFKFDRPYRCDDEGLKALGRAHKNDVTLDDEAALKHGASQFKVTFDQLQERFATDSWAKRHCLIATAGGNDGPPGLRTNDGSFDARRQMLEKFAHIIFSGRPKDAEFWSGQTAVATTEDIERDYARVKACIHGSDGHSTETLGVPDLSRFTWIKGNRSFDALRLGCLAPATRVYVGEQAPDADLTHGRLKAISVDRPDWFTSGSVPLNPGLIAIIGSRGSGKTALADLIAVAAGSSEPFQNEASFIDRAAPFLGDATATVTWTDDTTDEARLSSLSDLSLRTRGVRYLSQQFVEQLCSAKGATDELVHEIERVVFEAWPSDERQGASNFDELLQIQVSAARNRQAHYQDGIELCSSEIAELRAEKHTLPETAKTRQRIATKLKEEQAKQSGLLTRSSPDHAARLERVESAISTQTSKVEKADRTLTALTNLTEEIERRQARFADEHAKLQRDFREASLTPDQWSVFQAVYSGDVNSTLRNAKVPIAAKIQVLRGNVAADMEQVAVLELEKLNDQPLESLKAERTRLSELVGLDRERTAQLHRLTEEVAKLTSQIANIDRQLDATKDIDERIRGLAATRIAHYTSYFDALLEEEKVLNELYAPLQTRLANFGGLVEKLSVSIRRKVDLNGWSGRGEQHLDTRTIGAFKGRGELRALAEHELFHAWSAGTGADAAEAIRSFSSKHSDDFRKQAKADRAQAENWAIWERELSTWLYNADHVTLEYSIDYSGLSIDRHSPGQRGIVLLLLYLAVDRIETDPLIIDQPEENLDPESIYSELVSLFRAAASRRQIIMVTHNANLVVNTDVDQVIVARCGPLDSDRLPQFSYTTGGLDDPAIRKSVCEVLEGGTRAFQERARRLAIELA